MYSSLAVALNIVIIIKLVAKFIEMKEHLTLELLDGVRLDDVRYVPVVAQMVCLD